MDRYSGVLSSSRASLRKFCQWRTRYKCTQTLLRTPGLIQRGSLWCRQLRCQLQPVQLRTTFAIPRWLPPPLFSRQSSDDCETLPTNQRDPVTTKFAQHLQQVRRTFRKVCPRRLRLPSSSNRSTSTTAVALQDGAVDSNVAGGQARLPYTRKRLTPPSGKILKRKWDTTPASNTCA